MSHTLQTGLYVKIQKKMEQIPRNVDGEVNEGVAPYLI